MCALCATCNTKIYVQKRRKALEGTVVYICLMAAHRLTLDCRYGIVR
jgi:hypothetical protein